MKFLAIFLILTLGSAATYQRYVVIPALEGEVSSLETEISDLKDRVKSTHKQPKEKEVSVKEVATEPLEEPSKVVPKTTSVKVDNSQQIAQLEASLVQGQSNFESQKAVLEAEIQRGLEARKIAQSAQGNFKERTNGSSIRTSDADRQIWEADKKARIEAINNKLKELETQKSQLESNFRSWSRGINEQISNLK